MFQGEYGDRRQELVFIGIDMDESAIRSHLDHCLLTPQEMHEGPSAWSTWEDGFGDQEEQATEPWEEREAAGD